MPVTLEQITAATDAFALQKLEAQAYLEDLARAQASREEALRHNAAVEALFARQCDLVAQNLALLRQQATAFDASERGKVMQEAFEQLITVYMKPSTASTPEGRLADVVADGDFLLKGVQKVMAAYDALRAGG